MTYEPHPFPESRFWRIAPPVTAAVLAAVGFGVMLGAPAGPARTVVLVVVLVAQVVLLAGRAIVLFRAGRIADRPVYWHQFFFLWSFYSGGTSLLDGDGTTVAAAIDVGAGLGFAAVLTGIFRVMNRVTEHRPRGDLGS